MDKRKQAMLRQRPWSARQDAEDEQLLANSDEEAVKMAQFNSRIRDELRSIPVPPALRGQILGRRKMVRIDWRGRSALLALAAAISLVATALFFFARPAEDRSIAGFRSRMVGFALREYRMDRFTTNAVVLREFFAQKGVPADFNLPPRLAATPLKGGASLSWQGNPVSMVCFDWQGSETLYMFVLAVEPRSTETPQVEQVKKLSTVTWTEGGKTFVLAGRVEPEKLAAMVRS